MSDYSICFSPTGGTQACVDIVAAELFAQPACAVEHIDLCAPDFSPPAPFMADDLALIAVPSFGGRVPAPAAERLRQVQGGGAQAVLLCAYGNRAYEDTLVELADIAREQGFRVAAAIAAVAEHSIVRALAAGRPDADDADRLRAFAHDVRGRLANGADIPEPAIPGSRPYKKLGSFDMGIRPTKSCTSCMVCAHACSVGAIDSRDPARVDAARCFSCMRCVAVCPHGARRASKAKLAAVSAVLRTKCARRKEPELFL